MSAVGFGEQLFVLATITHVRDYHPTVSPLPTTEHEKHLRLLDDIALLLVTQGSSDVAAVMFEQTTQEIIFYYAKNRATTQQERAYIELLRSIALSLSDINDCTIKLLARVIPMCRAKIISRLKKLIRCLLIAPVVGEDIDGTFNEHLQLRLPLLLSRGLSPTNFVRNYISAVRAVNAAQCTNQDLEKLIRFASIIGSYKPLKNLLSDDTTIRRLRKLGNYYTATKRIARTVESFQRTNPTYLSSLNIVFREVLPPARYTSTYAEDYIAALNRYGRSRGLDAVTASALHAAYPRNPEPKGPTCPLTGVQRVTHSVHAECTLAMHALSLRREWKFVELGVSKGSCWLCEKFLHIAFAAHDVKFLVSGFHGKLQPGWTCPPLATARERAAIETLVADALAEIVERTLNRRRSDSFPLVEVDGPVQSAVEEVFAEDDMAWLGGV